MRHMVVIAHQQKQAVRANWQIQRHLCLAAAEMAVLIIGGQAELHIHCGGIDIYQQMVMAGIGPIHPGRRNPDTPRAPKCSVTGFVTVAPS